MPDNSEDRPQTQTATASSLQEHLEELRSHLLRIVAVLSLVFIIAAVFYTRLWDLAMLPRARAAELLGVDAATTFPLQLLGPAEGISIIAGLCFKIALGITLPFIFYESWKFISPGLKANERRAIRWILLAGTALFFCGVLAAFFIAVPTGLKFLVSFDRTLAGTVTQWRVDNYFSLLTMACFGFGVCFETPLIMLSLTIAGLLQPAAILKYWRHATIIIALLGALFTPPDPLTMLMLAGTMLLLYFFGYYLSFLAARRRQNLDNRYVEDNLGED